MLANKFVNGASSGGGGAKYNAVIMRTASAQPNKIVEIPIAETCQLTEALMKFVSFTVEEDGYYHLSCQLCLKNSTRKAVKCDYIQLGVCEDDLSDCQQNFSSLILNSIAEPDYVLSQNLTTIMKLCAGKEYVAFVNFASACNSAFEYSADCSHLRLYKL